MGARINHFSSKVDLLKEDNLQKSWDHALPPPVSCAHYVHEKHRLFEAAKNQFAKGDLQKLKRFYNESLLARDDGEADEQHAGFINFNSLVRFNQISRAGLSHG